jgi:hypothetical protein
MELAIAALVIAPMLVPLVIGAAFVGKARRLAPAADAFDHGYADAEHTIAA